MAPIMPSGATDQQGRRWRIETAGCGLEIAAAPDVVALEDGTGFVPGQLHGDPLRSGLWLPERRLQPRLDGAAQRPISRRVLRRVLANRRPYQKTLGAELLSISEGFLSVSVGQSRLTKHPIVERAEHPRCRDFGPRDA